MQDRDPIRELEAEKRLRARLDLVLVSLAILAVVLAIMWLTRRLV